MVGGDSSLIDFRLTTSRAQLTKWLDETIAKGRTLPRYSHIREFPNALQSYESWNEYNRSLLRRAFYASKPHDRYPLPDAAPADWNTQNPKGEMQAKFRELVEERCNYLKTLKDQLHLYEEPPLPEATQPTSTRPSSRDDIAFIVHGHPEAPKRAVAAFLREFTNLEPAILHEMPKGSKTIIEVLEAAGSNVGFAIVLLTGDDEGGVRGGAGSQRRARQNVVFELGLFIGMLGRERVAVLYEPGVELPSDLHGVLYTPLDAAGEWRSGIARELQANGFTVDWKA